MWTKRHAQISVLYQVDKLRPFGGVQSMIDPVRTLARNMIHNLPNVLVGILLPDVTVARDL